MSSDNVYLIYDVRNHKDCSSENVVAVVDNDEDFVRFMMLHKDEYPICKEINKSHEDIWKELCNGEDITGVCCYFKGIDVDRFCMNADYTDVSGCGVFDIDFLAEKNGIGHLLEDE